MGTTIFGLCPLGSKTLLTLMDLSSHNTDCISVLQQVPEFLHISKTVPDQRQSQRLFLGCMLLTYSKVLLPWYSYSDGEP